MTHSPLSEIKSAFQQSLASATLLKMAMSITIVILVTSGLIYIYVLAEMEKQAVDNLQKYIIERGEKESSIFQLAENNLSAFKFIFREEWSRIDNKELHNRFNELFINYSDGTIRSREELYYGKDRLDGTRSYYISAYIGKDVELTLELKSRIVLSYLLIDRFAQAWHTRFPNLYVSMPENVAIYYWPGITWGQNAASDLDVNQEEWVYVANPQNNPDRRQVWTGLYFDQTANEWVVSAETPIYIEGKHLLTVGNDILLNDLFDRTFNTNLPGVHNFIIREDGRLIAHAKRQEQLEQSKGFYNVIKSNDKEIADVVTLIEKASNKTGVVHDRINKQFVAYSKLSGPGWYFVSILPETIFENTALDVARFMIMLGILLLFIESYLLYIILRGQVIKPLSRFIRASQGMAKSSFTDVTQEKVLLPLERHDEVGKLAHSFNDMAKQLHEYGFQMEEKILERTKKLEDSQLELNIQKGFLEEMMDNMDQGIMMTRENFEILAYNKNYLQILNLPESLLNETNNYFEVLQFFGEKVMKFSPVQIQDLFEDARRKEKFEYVNNMPDGRIVEVRHIPKSDGGFVRIFSDITERRLRERTQEENRKKLEHALEAGKLGTWSLDISTGINTVNQQNAKLFGYTAAEMNGTSDIWNTIIHPDDFERVTEGLKNCISGKSDNYYTEFRAYTKDGMMIWIESIGNVISRNEKGNALIMSGIQADITMRKHAELSLRNNQQLLEGIIENSSLIIYAKDSSGRYILLNRNWETTHSVNREVALGKKDIEILPVKNAGPLHFNDMKVIEKGVAIELEETISTADGDVLTYLSLKFPLKSEDNEIVGVCCLSTNITDRKMMETTLQQSQEQLDLALEVGNMGIFEFDTETQSTTGNELYARLLGYDQDELNEKMKRLDFFEEIIHPDDYPAVSRQLGDVLQGNTKQLVCQFRAYTKQGELKWFDCTAIPVGRNTQGLPLKLVGTQADISVRKFAEESVRENQQLLDAVIQNNANIIFVKDKDGKYLLVNREFEKVMKITRENALGRTDHEIFGKEFGDYIRSNDLKVLNSRNQIKIEESVGSSIYLSLKFPMIDTQGKINGLCGMSTDITEQKQLQDKLIENQQLLEAVIENSGTVIYVKDKEGKYILVNREFERAVNLKQDDVIGKDDNDIYPADIAKEIIKNDQDVMTSEKLIRSEESPDGKSLYLSLKFPLFDANGKVDGVGGISTDITEQKQLQDNLAFRLDLERLVASISTKATHGSDIKNIVDDSLRDFGVLSESERVSLWQFNEDCSLVTMSNEWCAEGIEPQLELEEAINLPRSEVENLGLIKELESGNPYYIREIKTLTVDKKQIREFFEALEITSFAAIPIIEDNQLIAYFTINKPDKINKLNNPDLAFLKVFGEALHSVSKRMAAEQDLLKAKEQAEQSSKIADITLQNMDQGIVMVDGDNNILVYNNRLLEYLGIPENSAVNMKKLPDLYSAGKNFVDETVITRSKSIVNKNKPAIFEVTDLNGNTIEVNHNPLPNGGFVRTYSNITMLKKAIATAKEHQQELQELINATPVPMEITLYEGAVDLLVSQDFTSPATFYFNQSFTGTFGWTESDFSSLDDLLNKVYPDKKYRDSVLSGWAKLMEQASKKNNQFIGTLEIQFCCKNGDFKSVEASQSIIGNKQIFTLVDLTARKKAEIALSKSEERFKLAMETANVGLWDADLISGIAHYNEHYFKMLGYDRGEFEADHEKWIENIHPADRKRVKANADKLTQGKTEHSEIEFRMKASNGDVRHILSIGKITGRDEKNKPTRVTGIHLDITERKMLEALVNRKNGSPATTAVVNKKKISKKKTGKKTTKKN